MLLAILHCVITVRNGRTSESWDSANELVALAYNSKSKETVLENCGGGIVLMDTLKKMVRVGTTASDSGEDKVELVFVEDEDKAKRRHNRVVAGYPYS